MLNLIAGLHGGFTPEELEALVSVQERQAAMMLAFRLLLGGVGALLIIAGAIYWIIRLAVRDAGRSAASTSHPPKPVARPSGYAGSKSITYEDRPAR